LDEPIKYTTSKASEWTASQTHTGRMHPDVPSFQPLVIILSVSVFLLYFCVFREENDMDEEIGKTLWQRIPGLEKQQLLLVLRYNEERGISTTDIRNRLAEIEERDKELMKSKLNK
jgi:hypothetical protein